MFPLEAIGLAKHYGDRVALRGLDLRVEPGQCFGLLGPNGAGKTTFIRLALGLLHQTAGAARLFGDSGPAPRARVGYLPGDVRFHERLTCRAALHFFSAMRGGGHEREIDRLAERFGLPLDIHIDCCSRGMKQKVGLIQALMHRPDLLILDEPTTALDPLVRRELFAELRAAADAGRTVLFSSHTLAEVEALCDRVALLRGGELLACDRVEALRARAARHVFVLFDAAAPRAPLPAGLRPIETTGGRLVGRYVGEPGELLAWLSASGVRDFSFGEPDLEATFMGYYEGREASPPA